MWFGKIIGALLGYGVAGFFGVIFGVVFGHFFDKSLSKFRQTLSPEDKAQAEQLFFETVFKLMGYVAKADGRVSEEEISQVEQFMGQMHLTDNHRQEAISHFKAGAADDFDLVELLTRFKSISDKLPNLKQTILSYVVGIALADGHLDAGEEQSLEKISAQLGFSHFAFKQLLAMLRAQANFQQRGHQQHHQNRGQSGFQPTSGDELKLAYEALGVDDDVSDIALKKAYRKLMSENHPDKLMGQGVPQDMVDLATERSKNIQAAYDLIKKHRKQSAG